MVEPLCPIFCTSERNFTSNLVPLGILLLTVYIYLLLSVIIIKLFYLSYFSWRYLLNQVKVMIRKAFWIIFSTWLTSKVFFFTRDFISICNNIKTMNMKVHISLTLVVYTQTLCHQKGPDSPCWSHNNWEFIALDITHWLQLLWTHWLQ